MRLSSGDLRSRKRETLKKAIFYISVFVVVAYVAAAFVWTDVMARDEVCRGVLVDVKNGGDTAEFVSRQFILSELKRLGFNVAGRPVGDVDAERIERAFDKQYYVEYVECYKRSDDKLQLDIYPVKPLLRVFDKTGSYYINRRGKRVPAVADIFEDVPVAYGNFSSSFRPVRLLPLVDYLDGNPSARNLVSAIEVEDSTDIYVVPNIAGHVVNLGSLDNLDAKFRKLMRFYKEVMPVKGWDAYDTISLKWSGQIVATKRNAKSRLWIQREDIGHDEQPDPQQEISVYNNEKTEKPS